MSRIQVKKSSDTGKVYRKMRLMGVAKRVKENEHDIHSCIAELSAALEAAMPAAAAPATAAAKSAKCLGSWSRNILIRLTELRSPSHSRRILTFLGLV